MLIYTNDVYSESAEAEGMPNTNNKIEGTFTDLKKNLNNHSGLTKENRKRFISSISHKLLCLQPEKLPPSAEHALEMVSFR